jgi:hypothetical protein
MLCRPDLLTCDIDNSQGRANRVFCPVRKGSGHNGQGCGDGWPGALQEGLERSDALGRQRFFLAKASAISSRRSRCASIRCCGGGRQSRSRGSEQVFAVLYSLKHEDLVGRPAEDPRIHCPLLPGTRGSSGRISQGSRTTFHSIPITTLLYLTWVKSCFVIWQAIFYCFDRYGNHWSLGAAP